MIRSNSALQIQRQEQQYYSTPASNSLNMSIQSSTSSGRASGYSASDLTTPAPISKFSPSTTDPKPVKNFFGKKHKTARENAACLLACTINFIKSPYSKSNQQKLEKYFARCKAIISGRENQSVSHLADCEYFHSALHNLILHAHLLEFEQKKDVFTILADALKASPNTCVAFFAQHSKQITTYLLTHFEELEMSMFAGNMLRILLKQPYLQDMLDMQFLESIIKISMNAVFEIASESIEIFRVIFFKQKKQQQLDILSQFLLNNSQQISEAENYLIKRDILLTLNSILSQPKNQKLNDRFINDQEILKRVMNILSSESQGGFKEVALMLLNHFISGFSEIQNQKVRSIIIRNKVSLLLCIRDGISDEQKYALDETQQVKHIMIHILEEL